MFTFLKKAESNVILKTFRVVTSHEAVSFDVQKLIDVTLTSLETLFGTSPTNYYITGPYPDDGWKTKGSFLKAVERKQYRDICYLILSTNTYSFSYENWGLNTVHPNRNDYQAIEFSISEQHFAYSDVEMFFEKLTSVFASDYVFIFKLPSNYLPSTESRIKRGFFSSSVKQNEREVKWRANVTRIRSGLLKDIYPINFINDSVFATEIFQKEIVNAKIGRIASTPFYLYKWTLAEDEIKIAKSKLFNTPLLE